MSNPESGTDTSNGFRIVWEELKRRTKEPRTQVVYWTYFLGAVCAIGGVGIILEVVRYYYTESSRSPEAIYFAMATFFPALVGSSAMQIMFESVSDKRMIAVSVTFLIATFGLAIFLLSASGDIASSNWCLAAGACVFSLWIWWISNADNVGLYDEPPPPIDAALGGKDLNVDLEGTTEGFRT